MLKRTRQLFRHGVRELLVVGRDSEREGAAFGQQALSERRVACADSGLSEHFDTGGERESSDGPRGSCTVIA